jgi:short-subunit dehydrogenase
MKVLITGAASGIGYAAALELMKRNHFIYLTVETEEQLKEIATKEELKGKEGKEVQYFVLDITKESDRNLIRDLDIDVLINNAAIGNGGSIIEADEKRIRENFEVNFFGTILLTKVALEHMLKRDSGRIVMITSVLAEIPFAWLGMYSSTKAALKNISTVLSEELKELKSKVKVVMVEPGAYHTGFNQVMMDNKYDNEDSRFKDIREQIRTKEKLKFNLIESHDLTSVVDKIIHAVEDEKPDLIYKAPFSQSFFEKAYMMFKK